MTAQYIKVTEYGDKFYYKDKAMKIRHREDGPAYEGGAGAQVWYLNDTFYATEEAYNRANKKEVIITMDQIAAKFGVDIKLLKIAK